MDDGGPPKETKPTEVKDILNKYDKMVLEVLIQKLKACFAFSSFNQNIQSKSECEHLDFATFTVSNPELFCESLDLEKVQNNDDVIVNDLNQKPEEDSLDSNNDPSIDVKSSIMSKYANLFDKTIRKTQKD